MTTLPVRSTHRVFEVLTLLEARNVMVNNLEADWPAEHSAYWELVLRDGGAGIGQLCGLISYYSGRPVDSWQCSAQVATLREECVAVIVAYVENVSG